MRRLNATRIQLMVVEMSNRRAFVDFVEGLLNMDPIKRWSPQQAAKHPFITGEKFTGKFEVSHDISWDVRLIITAANRSDGAKGQCGTRSGH